VTRHAVVTGAAQGIGCALAQTLMAQGYTVTGLDIVATEPWVWAVDLTNADALDRCLLRLRAGPPVDLLIHNAGINGTGPFAFIAARQHEQIVRLNLLAPMHLTQALLQAQQLAPGATVVFVSSLSCFTGYPGASVYAATKDGLASYAASLRAALKPCGMRVLTVYPGPVRTAHAREHSRDNRREHRRMDPLVLAQQICGAVVQRRSHLVPGRVNQVSAWLGWLAPVSTARLMRRFTFCKRPSG
jgi:short-subunit dehydrogenase